MQSDTDAPLLMATEMALAHNIMISGLNSIYVQGPNVTAPKDVKAFLFYCKAWTMLVEHHHDTEEQLVFPKVEAVCPKLDIAKHKQQHGGFVGGVQDFQSYVTITTQEDYKWDDMKNLLDSFAPAMVEHLKDEIGTFLNLKDCDNFALLEADVILPFALGNADKTFENGAHEFPPLPFFIPYLVEYVDAIDDIEDVQGISLYD
ncbi:hypothetical protein BDY21DRAFT_360533 [Lineolata rhizophorae]|uniref:Hemerythrin-like domain-containing protein n=1 Tax=Lineolata rhizophorae TaxID=578093 RepID=A0A6A6PC32_9PEZI|nr:hypothetical protein BDY21DRAFT_360533 [Lineolata rhizophorae]